MYVCVFTPLLYEKRNSDMDGSKEQRNKVVMAVSSQGRDGDIPVSCYMGNKRCKAGVMHTLYVHACCVVHCIPFLLQWIPFNIILSVQERFMILSGLFQ